MKKYLQILRSYFQCSLMIEMEYVFNFFFGGIFELVWLIMYIILLNVIFLGTSTIGDWGKYEVLLLTFQGGLTDSLITCFVVPGICQLPDLVNTGKLDFYILKPINLRFNLTFRNFSFNQITNVFINIGGLIYCLINLNVQLNLLRILGYIVITLSGFVIIYSIMFVLMVLSFWIVRMDMVFNFCAELITIGNKPYTIYPKIIQKILIYAVPVLVAFNFPIIYLIKNNSFIIILISILSAALWLIFSNIIFKRGLKKYVSAGS